MNNLHLPGKDQGGFTLIEILISTAIMAIGFAGIYSLVTYSNVVLQNSIVREQLNLQANEIVEMIYSDRESLKKDNISRYASQLSDCNKIVSGTKDYQKRAKQWCEKLNNNKHIGVKKHKDKRNVYVRRKSLNQDELSVVTVVLTAKDGKQSIVLKRAFHAE